MAYIASSEADVRDSLTVQIVNLHPQCDRHLKRAWLRRSLRHALSDGHP
jgi:hypothetical protein